MVNSIDDIIKILKNVRESGFDKVDDSEFDKVLQVSTDVFKQINKYGKKHPLALDCPDDYIYQDDMAQVDAIDLVLNICEELSEYSEYTEDE